jgi:putative membrane protein
MRRAEVFWVAIVAVTIFAGCSKTDGTKTGASDQPGARPGAVGTGGAGANVKSDDDFVHDVAIMNMAEIELSRLAVDKATTPAIKAFAQQMIDEHAVAGNKLKSVVSGQPIEWPAELDDKHRKTTDELAKNQGADFDREYVKAMIDGHQNFTAKLEARLDVQSLSDWKTAAAGRTQTKALPDPHTQMPDVQVRPDKSGNEITMRINQWAADTYPVAQKHLDTARALDNATKKRPTD